MHAAAANDKIRFINYLFLERNPMTDWNIHEAVEYYKGQDAPQNQFALVELLKEAQEHNGGVLTDCLIEDIAALLNIKVTFLNAVIKRYPSLKTAQAPLERRPHPAGRPAVQVRQGRRVFLLRPQLLRQKLRRQRFGSAA